MITIIFKDEKKKKKEEEEEGTSLDIDSIDE